MPLKEVHLTQDQAEGLLVEWKHRLRLQDWNIKVKVARGNGLDLPCGVQGRCEWTLPRKEAFIRLMNPMDWDPDTCWPQDMEATLVHELLHLHFAPFDTFEVNTPEDTAIEQAIRAISDSLVQAKRGV